MVRWAFKTARILSCLVLSFSATLGLAQTQSQSLDQRKILVESFAISGTQSIDSAELAEITNVFAGSTFNDDADELQERIRMQFQDHGYFKAIVEKTDIKVIDPMASPKPVRVEAEVDDGPRCRLGLIEFTGNHSVISEELREKFPVKIGSDFRRSKIAGGMEKMRSLYASLGFLDLVFIPDTSFGDSGCMVKLSLEVREGPQYRMDKFEVVGPSELAGKLQTRWELEPGAVFDNSYLNTFLEKNHSLLPPDFTRSDGVDLVKNCPGATVSVRLRLTSDPQYASSDQEKNVDCPRSADAKPE